MLRPLSIPGSSYTGLVFGDSWRLRLKNLVREKGQHPLLTLTQVKQWLTSERLLKPSLSSAANMLFTSPAGAY